MIDGKNLIRVNLVDDGDASQHIGVSRNRKLSLQQPLAAPLRDLNLEALNDLPFMVKQRKNSTNMDSVDSTNMDSVDSTNMDSSRHPQMFSGESTRYLT